LPVSALDLKGGWLSYARIKTGVDRRIPLWPETVAAIREALTERPAAKRDGDADLVFLTRCGERWHKDTNAAPLSREFRKLAETVGAYRKGVAFYGLRHSFRTVADDTRDFPAIDMIMGHSDQSMASHYRERISDDRLRAVVEHVHKWLFGWNAHIGLVG
jgi:integrase